MISGRPSVGVTNITCTSPDITAVIAAPGEQASADQKERAAEEEALSPAEIRHQQHQQQQHPRRALLQRGARARREGEFWLFFSCSGHSGRTKNTKKLTLFPTFFFFFKKKKTYAAAAAANSNNNQNNNNQPSGYLAPFSGTEAQRDNGGALVEVRLDFKNASAAEEAAAALRKSAAGTGQLATAMGTRGVQTKGLNVLSTRVSHLSAEPKKAAVTTTQASTKGGDVSTPATPKVHHGAAIAAVFALFAITAALSGSVVYVRKRRNAAALAAAECPLAPSATTTEGSEQGSAASPRSNCPGGKSKVTEDGGALEAAAADENNATTSNKNGRRRGAGGAGATATAAFGSSNTSSSSDESSGSAAEKRPLSAGRRGGNSKKAPAPSSHRLSADEAV